MHTSTFSNTGILFYYAPDMWHPQLQEKSGGKVIHRVGGVVFLYRGRNYNPRTRPRYPLMLWKPATPVYPKLIQEAPEGLTKEEADEMRRRGKDLLPICKLGMYLWIRLNICVLHDVQNPLMYLHTETLPYSCVMFHRKQCMIDINSNHVQTHRCEYKCSLFLKEPKPCSTPFKHNLVPWIQS